MDELIVKLKELGFTDEYVSYLEESKKYGLASETIDYKKELVNQQTNDVGELVVSSRTAPFVDEIIVNQI